MTRSILAWMMAAVWGVPAFGESVRQGDWSREFAVPRLDGVAIDGLANDWGQAGLRVDFLWPYRAPWPDPADLSASLRVAWMPAGLLVFCEVTDPTRVTSADDTRLYESDAVECFLAAGVGSEDFYQFIMVPATDPTHTTPRTKFIGHGRCAAIGRPAPLAICTPTEQGYRVEALLPWPAEAATSAPPSVAFQIFVDDGDEGEAIKSLSWYPTKEAWHDTTQMHVLHLVAGAAGERVAGFAGYGEANDQPELIVLAAPALASNTVSVWRGEAKLGEAKLARRPRFSLARLPLPARTPDVAAAGLTVRAGDGVRIVGGPLLLRLGHDDEPATPFTPPPGSPAVPEPAPGGAPPHVIALSSFDTHLAFSTSDVESLALRDQLAGELAAHYDCCTLSRAEGYNLAVERTIRALQTGQATGDAFIPAADIAVTGFFDHDGQRRPRFTLQWLDLRTAGPSRLQTATFASPPPGEAAPYIAQQLARIVGLAQRQRPPFRTASGAAPRTWAVLPFAWCQETATLSANSGRREPLSAEAELALQDVAGARLVDAAAVGRALDEMKIQSMNGLTEGFAADLSRLVGADCMLIGSVTRPHDYELRMDLCVVDGARGVVLDAGTAWGMPEFLPDAARALTLRLANRTSETPALRPASEEARLREAHLYLGLLHTSWLGSASYLHKAGLALSAYAVMSEDPETIDDVGEFLAEAAVPQLAAWNMTHRAQGREIAGSLARLADELLGSRPESYARLRERSYAMFSVEDYEALITLLDRMATLDAEQTQQDEWVQTMRLTACAELGRTDEARRLLDHVAEGQVKLTIADRIGQRSGDPRLEYDMLRAMPLSDPSYWGCRELDRYAELMGKFDGPRAVVNYIRGLTGYSTSRPDLKLRLARAHLALGEKLPAQRLLCSLLRTTDAELVLGVSHEFCPDPRAFHTEVAALLGSTGGYEEAWRTAAEVGSVPRRYVVYIVPTGRYDRQIVRDIADRFAAFCNARVEILAPLRENAIPPALYSRIDGTLNRQALYRLILEQRPFPEAAIFVAAITADSFGDQDEDYTTHDGFYLYSYSRPLSIYRQDTAHFAVVDMLSEFLDCLLREEGKNPAPCLFHPCARSQNNWRRSTVLTLCEDCQKDYAHADFEKLHQHFQKVYGRGSP